MLKEVKKNFGFGCMRLPMIEGEVDTEEFCRMIDTFLARGFNYFDTAHGYLDGKSELALRQCLVARYPRESYILANKLSGGFIEKEEDILPFFYQQLECCGVDYFDFYLMHAQSRNNFDKFKACRAYETALELRAQGKIKHLGISFHDTADFLEQILTEYPQIEVVQIQFNYADYDDPKVESKKCYDVCRKYGKPVIVMEPVKGGTLVDLPDAAKDIFDRLGTGSYASYAIRFAADFEGIMMVLSGMGSMEMMLDNCSYMENFRPLNKAERNAVGKVRAIIHNLDLIACTSCRYCTTGCPMNIDIPALFACMNGKRLWNDDKYNANYHNIHTANGGKASDCIVCGQCEKYCPQRLPIRDLLRKVAATFEK